MNLFHSLKKIALWVVFTAALFSASAYVIILPETQPTPALPYSAEADHYSGPACIQMALNSCPTISGRHLNSQNDIYTSIINHNSEPTLWFSSPAGMQGASMDPVFSPCGHWVDFSNTDKNIVLGNALYYLKSMKYLAPVSIGVTEHWVNIIGYQTDVEPASPGNAVTLQYVFFYDPLPGSAPLGWVSGNTWLGDITYWGAPINKPGSSWNNKYLAVIEPPKVSIKIKVPGLVRKGTILPPEKISGFANKWFEDIAASELVKTKAFFRILQKPSKAENVLLVNASKYSYYVVRLNDGNVSAVFNAYDGSFEELRIYNKPRIEKLIKPDQALSMTKTELIKSKKEIGEMTNPVLIYDPSLCSEGRLSPVWQMQATLKKNQTTKQNVIIDMEGNIRKGL